MQAIKIMLKIFFTFWVPGIVLLEKKLQTSGVANFASSGIWGGSHIIR